MATSCNDARLRVRPPLPPPRRNVNKSKPVGGTPVLPLVPDSSSLRRVAIKQPLLPPRAGPRARPPPLPTEAESCLSVTDVASDDRRSENLTPARSRLPYKPPDLPVVTSRYPHRTQRSVSDTGFEDTFRSDCEFDDAGDESLTEVTRQCPPPAAPETPVVRQPLGLKRGLLCVLYAISLLFTLAALAPRAIVVGDCQFQHTLTEENCTEGGGKLNRLRRSAGIITTLFLATWLVHISICVVVIVKCPSIFDRPVDRSSIFRRLRHLHHFWTFLVITVCAVAFEGFQFSVEKYRRPVALSDSFGIVVSALWALQKTASFLLMSILNYTPDVKMTFGWTPRVLYKLTLLAFAVMHFNCFLSTSVYVLLKVMPQGTTIRTAQTTRDHHKNNKEAADEIIRIVAFLLLIMNAVFHAKMVVFFSTKILSANKNLLHFVHEDVFRNRHAINSRYFSGVATGADARYSSPLIVDHPSRPVPGGAHATYYGSHSIAPHF